MENYTGSPNEISEAMRLAMTPAGKQLLELLQKTNSQTLQGALEDASRGNYAQAKQTINEFLSTPEAKKLLEQLRNNP